jgi:hypothetical protein
MKKQFNTMFGAIFIGFALLLASCGSQPAPATSAANSSSASASAANSSSPSTSVADDASAGTSEEATLSLSLPMMAVATLKLEGTEAAVTPKQAAELLPLWQAANSLSASDNVTAAEMDAVLKQIQESMTVEQIDAIQPMDLTRQNIASLAQELGIDLPANNFANLTPEQQATAQAARQSGQMPQGVVPGQGFGSRGGQGGGFPAGGEGFSPPAGAQGTSGGFGAVFYQAVIDLLETKIQ